MAAAFFVNTPIGASPRGDFAADSRGAWAFAAAASAAASGDVAVGLQAAAAHALMQAPAPISKRSVSTLSLGDNQEFADPATPRLTRFMSEDIMGLLYPANATAPAAAEQDNSWGGLAGIREDSEEAGSPTNVDDSLMPALARGKSGDFLAGEDGNLLFRNRSDDLPFALLARARSENFSGLTREGFSGLTHILNPQPASAASAEPQQQPQQQQPASRDQEQVAKEEGKQHELDSESYDDEVHSGEDSSDTETRRAAAFLAKEAANARRMSTRNAGKPKRKLVDTDEEESDDDYVPGGKGAGRSAKRAKKASSSPGVKYSHNNRGAHVKGRPEMQETARRGQEHWAREVQELRERWREERCWEADSAFQGQLELLARRHIKSQHECLLRCLHIAAARGMVKPAPYNNGEGKSFLGWTGFSVMPNRAQEFREMVEAMFPTPLLENTLHNTFRRAGLVPGSWGEAWLGLSPFMYKKQGGN